MVGARTILCEVMIVEKHITFNDWELRIDWHNISKPYIYQSCASAGTGSILLFIVVHPSLFTFPFKDN